MKRKMRTSQEKLEVMMAGIKGRKISDICTEYGINQTQYYEWRDKFLNGATSVFDDKRSVQSNTKLAEENRHLKELVADLSIELKKTEGVWK